MHKCMSVYIQGPQHPWDWYNLVLPQIKLLGWRRKGNTFGDWFSFSSSLMAATSFADHIWCLLLALCQV